MHQLPANATHLRCQVLVQLSPHSSFFGLNVETTAVLSKHISNSIDDLLTQTTESDTCTVLEPASSHRPHRNIRHDLNFHPSWASNITLASLGGYESKPLAFRGFNNAAVLGDSGVVIDDKGRFVEETLGAMRYRDPEMLSIKNIALHRMPPDQVMTTPCLFSNHGSYAVFGHFLLETMVSVFAVRPLIDSGSVKLVMPQGRSSWRQELLASVGLQPDTYSQINKGITKFSRLIVSNSTSASCTFCPNPMTLKFAEQLRRQATINPKKHRIFITRSGAQTTSTRNLRNEQQIIAALIPFGFSAIEPGKLTFAEQVQLFANAEVVIGVHGSAFANVIFAPNGCVVGEILPDQWASKGGAWIGNLTNICNLQYFYLIAKSEKVPGGYEVEIDVDVVVDRIRQLSLPQLT